MSWAVLLARVFHFELTEPGAIRKYLQGTGYDW